MDENRTLEDAIRFTAEAWSEWSSTAAVPPNVNVRDRLSFFAPAFKARLFERHPSLRSADNQVLLLILAEAVARSGTDPRAQIEASLGLRLPPTR